MIKPWLLDLPSGWAELQHEACAFVATGGVARSGFRPNVNVVLQEPPTKRYLELTLSQLEEALDGFYLVEVDVDGVADCLTLSFGHIQGGQRLASIQHHVASEAITAIATATCAAADLSEEYALICATARSLRLAP